MNNWLCTETAHGLYATAARDFVVMSIFHQNNEGKHKELTRYNKRWWKEAMRYSICQYGTLAVEKYLKGYIINNGKQVEKIFWLDVLHHGACLINRDFEKIKSECLFLNMFVPQIRYCRVEPISERTINRVFKSLQAICDFPPIKELRESFGKQYGYQVLTPVSTNRIWHFEQIMNL